MTVFGQFIASLLAKFAQRDRFDFFLVRLNHLVDLTGWQFPDRRANRDAFLANENNSPSTSHRRNDDGGFPMHNRPSPWYHPCWCPDIIGHDFQVRVPKMPVARDS